MAEFEIIEQQALRMVKAKIENEQIRAEAGALHYMLGSIQLESKAPSASGFLKSFVTSEKIFRPTYTGTGEIYFGPPIFGEYKIFNLQDESWVLDQGAYVCSEGAVEIGVFQNKAITGLLGEGFFQTKISGTGKVVFKAPGPLQPIDLQNNTLTVDGKFAVARQAHLDYEVRRAAKGLIGSLTSGEGLVNVISGTGRVYLAPVPNIYVNLVTEIVSSMPVSSS